MISERDLIQRLVEQSEIKGFLILTGPMRHDHRLVYPVQKGLKTLYLGEGRIFDSQDKGDFAIYDPMVVDVVVEFFDLGNDQQLEARASELRSDGYSFNIRTYLEHKTLIARRPLASQASTS